MTRTDRRRFLVLFAAIAALIALSGALALPAQAQTATEVWTATLTVKAGAPSGAHGYNNGGTFGNSSVPNFGTLSDDNFDVVEGGTTTTYTIESLRWGAKSGSDKTLFIELDSTAPAKAVYNTWTLHIGDDQFPFSEAFLNTTSHRFNWGRAYATLTPPALDATATVKITSTSGTPPPDNSAPVFSDTMLTRSVVENAAADTDIGAVIPEATDDDGDTLEYSMEGTDATSFTFDASARQIKTSAALDFEEKSSYSVTVKADDGTASGTVTVTISVTDKEELPARPDAPTVSATSGSTTSLDVSWTAPDNTGKPPITSYDLRYRAGDSGTWTNGPQVLTGTSSVITGLTAATEYQVQVGASNADGDGNWSAAGTGSTTAPTCTLNTGDIWCGVVTVGTVIDQNGVTTGHGFEGTTGDLSDKMFTVGTNPYTINAIITGSGNAAGYLSLALTEVLSNADENDLVLHVDNDSFAFSAASRNSAAYNWASSGLDWSDGNMVTLRLRDTAATTTVTIAADQAAFTAALDDVTFTLTRTEDPAAALDVAVALTQDQTLLASADLAQTVTFAAGEASATLIIQNHKFASHTVTEDAATLTATVQDGTGYEPGSPNTVSTRIVVADPAVTAWIEATAYTFAEDATGNDATITVILRTATGVPSPNRSIYLSFSTAEISGQAESDADYVRQSQLHEVFPADFVPDGDDFTARKEITLVIVDDAITEPDETLTVLLEPGPSTSALVALRQPDGTACTVRCEATVTITDDDAAAALPELSVAGAAATEGSVVTFTVTLSEASTAAVTATWTASIESGDTAESADFTDLSMATGMVTVAVSDTTATFTVATVDDSTDEDNDTFTLTLSTPTNATLAADPTATGTIVDNDDPPMLSVADASAAEGSAATFTVTLSAAATADVTATWTASLETGDTAAAADFTDLSAATGTVTVTKDETTATFTVATAQDTTDEENETFTVTLSTPSSNATLAADPTATGTINDDDAPPAAPTNFTAQVGDAQVALAWDPPASDSGVTGHEFRYKTDGDYPLTWTAIANSGPDEANEDSFTVTMLTNEEAHTFELQAVNDSGAGDAAMAGPVTPTPGICDRTQKIQEVILAELSGVDDCAAVTVEHLASITTLGAFGLSTSSQGITSLQKGDFAGLTSLTLLNLSQNSLTALPEGIFAGLAELAELKLNGNQLQSLPEGVFDGLLKLQRINLVSNSLTELRAGEFTGLTALADILLSHNDLSSLPEELFSDLTALEELWLIGNDLDSLPEELFSGLTALGLLYLSDNDLNALPEGLFSGLTALESLKLDGNDLSSLPEELFLGLASLRTLYMDGNTNTLPLTVTVEKVGTNQVRAKVLAGAPFAVAIPVTLVNGTLEGSVTELSVAAGEVYSEPVTMTRTAGTTAAATVDVDLTTQPTLPANHQGYEFVKATVNLPATILPDETNAAPAFTSSATFNPAENQTAVGTVMASDDDTGDDITGYELSGGADQALLSIGSTSGVLTFQAAPNYEDPQDANTDNAYVVVVQATSGTGARVKTAVQTITVTVMDEDEQSDTPAKPTVTAVEGSATSLTATWTKPGLNGGPDITSYDVDYREGMSGTWTFGVRTTGEVTATIDGLTANTEHQVRVRALNGETPSDWSDPSEAVRTNTEAATTPSITDVAVTSTPVLETDTYGAGEDIEFTVTFDEAVDVAGDPIFRIALGNVGSAGDVDAAYASGGGTTALVFSYTVLSTDVDDNGIFLYDDMDLDNPDGPVRLDSDDSIVAVAGAAAADLTWTGGRGTQSGHKVDGSRSIIQVEVSSTPVLESDTYGAGETIRFTVTFNVAVDVAGDPIFRFALGNSGDARDVDAAYASGSGTTALVFSYTVVSTDVDGNGIFLYDGADLNNPDGPVRLDSDDSIQFTGTSTDVPLAWPSGRGTQSSHKVDGSQTPGNSAPVFSGTTATRSVVENTGANQNVGAVIPEAMDDDGDSLTYSMEGTDAASFTFDTTARQIQTKTGVTYNHEEKSTYSVTVKADDDNGGTATVVVTITVTDVAEQPATPAKPTLAVVSSTSLTATWVKPGLNGGPDITGYNVNYRVSTATAWETFTHSGAGVTRTITGLTASTSYQVRVRALNGETPSAWSDASDAVRTNADTDTPTVEPGELEDRIQAINCALDALDGESDERCDDIEGMPGSNRDLVALQLEVIGQLPPGKYDYYELAGWQTLYKMEDGRVIITKDGDAGTEAPAPLTARLEGVPEAHDGETAFRFRVAFSEDIGIDDQSLRDHSFTVSGGEVTGAQRDRHDLWEITVAPDSDGDVTITLPGDRKCGTAGAVCTRGDDPSPLTNSPSATVAGPAGDGRDPNTAATGTPTISGTPQVGETLTVDTSGIADEDGLNDAVFGYQWLADDDAIQGATGSTYTLTDSEEGKAINVEVSFTDDAGNGESLTSGATDAVAAAPQANNPATGAPAINGTAQVGETLTADTSGIADADGISNAEFAYQWQADDTDISGATGSAYTLADAEEGKAIKVQVSFTDDAGNEQSLTSTATDLVAGNEEPVAREDVVAWSATMTVEWVYQGYGYYSTDTKKAGSLSPASFEVDGTTYTVKIVETQGWWTHIGVDREIPFDFVLELDGVRFASGDASFASYSYGNIYRWEGTGLSLRDGDAVEVRLHRALEDETAVNSAATGAPIISGTVQVGETLTADTSGIEDADGLDDAAFTYRWLADAIDISGATGSTYTLADADENKAITVQVSFTDDAGNDETLTSAATDAVAAAPPENSAATGAPTISGTVQVDETLTADTTGIADEDGLDDAVFGYQWLADAIDISGATGSTYTLPDADEGKAITVQVSFTDDAGNDETLTSVATDAVAAAPQPNNPSTGAPTISGTAQVGETLTADTSGVADEDGLESVTFSYQWLSGDSDISGATGSAYTPVEADEGKTVKVRVSFTDDGGNDETLTSAATEAVAGNEEPVAREDVAAWSATMTVEWVYQGYGYYSTDTKKAGSLTPASFEVDGTTYTVKIVETQGWWTHIGVDRELPFDFVLELDGTRFASSDASFASYSYGNIYRWEGTGLSLRDGDVVEVRLLRAFEDETAVNSAATGAPIISGTVQVGETLTVDTSGIEDADGLDDAAFTYRWLADNAAIAGATGSTYTLADADEGKAITVQVSFTDDAGNDETLTSEATDAVSAATQPNNPATGAPTISGTAQVGETLTAGTSGIVDADGLTNATFNYQWLADDTDISGATGSTYTLVEADEGKAITVQVSFTDDAGNDETLTSGATGAVATAPASNTPATGAPAISGTAQVGETLAADTSGIADADGLSGATFSYQWVANDGTSDTDITGATDSTYTLAAADEGKTIKVRVSFTDDAGYGETLTSPATGIVAAALLPLTASLENMPDTHDGQNVFTFELRFSEEFSLSYKMLRDHAFTVAGGTVEKAERITKGSNLRWLITVRPDGDGQVTITLPATTDCDAEGAICTGDGRMLSNELVLTVDGPGQ